MQARSLSTARTELTTVMQARSLSTARTELTTVMQARSLSTARTEPALRHCHCPMCPQESPMSYKKNVSEKVMNKSGLREM